LAEIDYPGTRGTGVRDLRHATAHDGNDIDDRTTGVMLAPQPCSALHHVPGAVQIGIDDRVPTLDREADGGRWILSAAVVDHGVDLTEALPGRLHELLDLRRIADRHRLSHDLAADALLHALRRLRQLLGAPPADHNVRAKPREHVGNRTADAAAAAR